VVCPCPLPFSAPRCNKIKQKQRSWFSFGFGPSGRASTPWPITEITAHSAARSALHLTPHQRQSGSGSGSAQCAVDKRHRYHTVTCDIIQHAITAYRQYAVSISIRRGALAAKRRRREKKIISKNLKKRWVGRCVAFFIFIFFLRRPLLRTCWHCWQLAALEAGGGTYIIDKCGWATGGNWESQWDLVLNFITWDIGIGIGICQYGPATAK
jgi:hypothetical protein